MYCLLLYRMNSYLSTTYELYLQNFPYLSWVIDLWYTVKNTIFGLTGPGKEDMLKSKLKSSPMLIKLFISYIVIIIVPLSIIGIVSDKTLLSYAEKELSVSFIRNLEVSDQIFGLWSENAQKQALNLAINRNMKLIDTCPDIRNIMKERSSYILAEGLFQELNTAVSLNSHYSSVAIYPEKANYVISSGCGIKPKTEYDDTPWITEYIDGNHFVSPYARPSGAEYTISFLYPLALYQTPVSGYIILNIRESALSALINGGNPSSEGSIFIINTEGNIISTADRDQLGRDFSDEPWFLQIRNAEAKSGYFKMQTNQENYLYNYYKSSANGFIYVSKYSLNHLTDQVNGQRALVIGIILVIAAVGILASYLISRFLYSPIRSLTSKIERYDKKPVGKNEIVFLSDTFEDIIGQVEKGKADSFENYLLRLLNGTSRNDRTLFMNSFSPGCFCCILIKLDGLRGERIEPTIEELNLYFSFIVEYAKREFADFYFCEGVDINRLEFALILNFSTTHKNRIPESLRRIQEAFRLEYEFTFSAGIGGISESGGELYKSYRQAGLALQKRLIYGYGCVVEYQEETSSPEMYHFPVELEKSIENNLSAGNYDKLESTLELLSRGIKDKSGISPDNIYQIFNQIIGMAVKYLIENHINTQTIFSNRTTLYQELEQCETLDELQSYTLNVFRQIVDYLKLNTSGKNGRVEYICKYLQEHYHQDINLSDLAESAGISVSHMRRIFSEETGNNILYYINSLRINEAKELLQNSHDSISEIAAKVGYFNNQSFNRFFKKYEGVTPSEYRNSRWESK